MTKKLYSLIDVSEKEIISFLRIDGEALREVLERAHNREFIEGAEQVIDNWDTMIQSLDTHKDLMK